MKNNKGRLFIIVNKNQAIGDGEILDEEELLETEVESDETIYEIEIKGKVTVNKIIEQVKK